MKREVTFALIIWISIFAFLELGVRAYDLVRGARKADTVTTSNHVSIFSPHPYAVYVGNPGHDGHNAQGFRAANNRVYSGDPNAFTIACMGGSSTYGTQVPLEDSYPHQLELALAEDRVPAELDLVDLHLRPGVGLEAEAHPRATDLPLHDRHAGIRVALGGQS